MSTIRQTLSSIALFEGLDPSEVQRIADIGRVEYFRAGTTVLEQGETGPRLLVLLEGRAQILREDADGVSRSIAECQPGEALGEISLLLDLPRTATVRALDDLRCFTMDRQAFQEMVDEGDPAALKTGMALARMLAARLITLNDRILELLAADDPTRLHDRFANERQSLFRLWS